MSFAIAAFSALLLGLEGASFAFWATTESPACVSGSSGECITALAVAPFFGFLPAFEGFFGVLATTALISRGRFLWAALAGAALLGVLVWSHLLLL